MTRDEFVKALCLVYTREHGYLVAGDALFSSDTEQRRVIEQFRKELELLKADDAERCALIRDMEEEERRKDAVIEQQAQQIATLREALKELYALVQGECPRLLNEDSGGDAELGLKIEQALKEVNP